MKTLRLLTAVSIAALIAAPSAALAQQKTLYVAGYGGSFEKTIRDEVIPAFEKENGVKVEYVAGNSTDTLAKLQAQNVAPPWRAGFELANSPNRCLAAATLDARAPSSFEH